MPQARRNIDFQSVRLADIPVRCSVYIAGGALKTRRAHRQDAYVPAAAPLRKNQFIAGDDKHGREQD